MNEAVLFIIFNRPDTTTVAFDRLRQVRPARLYVAADGPRASREGEEELCRAARQVTELVDWPCEVKRLYRDHNLGCGKGVSGALNWFFYHEERGIIIEDDIVPHPDFFGYCHELLDHYNDKPEVMHINGCNFQQGVKRSDGSYYFSAFPHVWGWASWRRAWKTYDLNLSDVNYFYNLKKLRRYFSDKNITRWWYQIFFRMNQKQIDTWDYQWNYAIWNSGGKVITPNMNMIRNVGFGADATHTHDTNSRFADLETFPVGKIIHPSSKEINMDADRHTFKYCN
jgi:hypothetical protein